ncbi:hypothetical protein CBM2637_B140086 [Cupriavidus taiwanensis]|nr:hypothetical protein CBM2637_B140086 [Cupriavidus taiwanensis]SPA54752.1 protein of unknown function [Cupriavidus taiwanensis]
MTPVQQKVIALSRPPLSCLREQILTQCYRELV